MLMDRIIGTTRTDQDKLESTYTIGSNRNKEFRVTFLNLINHILKKKI